MKKTTTDTVAEFFGGFAERRHEPLLDGVSGTLRFDLVDGKRAEHWYVTIKNGDVAISRKDARADAIVRADKTHFEAVASGKVNAMAAALRGVLVPEGNLALLMSFQRLFPGPTASGAKAGTVGRDRRSR